MLPGPGSDIFGVRVKSPAGAIETISPEQFRERFGVEYAQKLIIENGVSTDSFNGLAETDEPKPAEWQRRALQFYFGQNLIRTGQTASLYSALKQWLYAEKVGQAYTANLYFGMVPAIAGWGIFAGDDIEPGELIGEYTGVVRYRVSEDSDNPYLFNYSGRLVLDAKEKGNYTRNINHGKKNANAACVYVYIADLLHVLLVATSHIPRDRQILFDYGDGYWRSRGVPVELE